MLIQTDNTISVDWRACTETSVRGTPAQPGGGCPGRDRERDSGRIPRSDVAHCDAAALNGSDRILSHGAPPWRMTPNGCLGNPAIVSLPSWQRLPHGRRTDVRTRKKRRLDGPYNSCGKPCPRQRAGRRGWSPVFVRRRPSEEHLRWHGPRPCSDRPSRSGWLTTYRPLTQRHLSVFRFHRTGDIATDVSAASSGRSSNPDLGTCKIARVDGFLQHL